MFKLTSTYNEKVAALTAANNALLTSIAYFRKQLGAVQSENTALKFALARAYEQSNRIAGRFADTERELETLKAGRAKRLANLRNQKPNGDGGTSSRAD